MISNPGTLPPLGPKCQPSLGQYFGTKIAIAYSTVIISVSLLRTVYSVRVTPSCKSIYSNTGSAVLPQHSDVSNGLIAAFCLSVGSLTRAVALSSQKYLNVLDGVRRLEEMALWT